MFHSCAYTAVCPECSNIQSQLQEQHTHCKGAWSVSAIIEVHIISHICLTGISTRSWRLQTGIRQRTGLPPKQMHAQLLHGLQSLDRMCMHGTAGHRLDTRLPERTCTAHTPKIPTRRVKNMRGQFDRSASSSTKFPTRRVKNVRASSTALPAAAAAAAAAAATCPCFPRSPCLQPPRFPQPPSPAPQAAPGDYSCRWPCSSREWCGPAAHTGRVTAM